MGEREGEGERERGGPGGVLRTKANCLQVCKKGPIAVVYPEGEWARLTDWLTAG